MSGSSSPFVARRSGGARTATTMMLAKLESAGGLTLCRVRNISDGGMMIEAPGKYAPGDRLSVSLRNDLLVTGQVVWAAEGRLGLQFDAPMPVSDLLTPALKPTSRIRRTRLPRPARFQVLMPVTVQFGGASHQASLCDISQGGARLRLGLTAPPRLGETVLISIPELGDKRAVVRWAGAELGLAFVAPLSFEALSPWLSAHALKASQPV